MKRFMLLSSLLVLGFAGTINGQTLVINPTTATFTASPDHSAVQNTVPLVSNYELRIFQSGGTTPVRTVNLNKPTPDASNVITVSVVSTMALLAPGDYFGQVAAIGPGGEGVSANSNPFQVKPRAPGAPTNLLFSKSVP
jgi:hypothetical protein